MSRIIIGHLSLLEKGEKKEKEISELQSCYINDVYTHTKGMNGIKLI